MSFLGYLGISCLSHLGVQSMQLLEFFFSVTHSCLPVLSIHFHYHMTLKNHSELGTMLMFFTPNPPTFFFVSAGDWLLL